MRLLAVTQRTAVVAPHNERRDCLDQAWSRFLLACGFIAVPIPNDVATARALFRALPLAGIVLTGGDDLVACGGEAPERDATEAALVEAAESKGTPVLGVCRGMQLLQHRQGISLKRVSGHVTPSQIVVIEGRPEVVNSYHHFGTREWLPPLEPWALAEDGIIKAVRHKAAKQLGIMWHPERIAPFAERDVALFRSFFGN
jgi:N5-(cytidine 5'-diphosphoramidyl)-L-glutamine hydrolase